jgi:hypothetical protein
MQKRILAAVALVACIGTAQADTPPNVRCAVMALEAARNTGLEFKKTYNRKFELCMLSAMPRERQTAYLVEKLQPYVAVSPRLEEQEPARNEKSFIGTWVRISPNVWVLER